MKKTMVILPLAVCMLLLVYPHSVHAQSGGNALAVLPFTGGESREGEAIAQRLENELSRNRQFEVRAWSNISYILEGEYNFRENYKGLFDPSSLFEMGTELKIRYIATGLISKIGQENLVIVAILDIDTLEQVAGAYGRYTLTEEILDMLPAMAKDLEGSTKKRTGNKQGLAIPRFRFANDGDVYQNEAETLAQILAVEIVNSGKYAVMPRTGNIDAVRAGRDSNSGDGPGKGRTPELVLQGVASRVGSRNSFDVQIIDFISWGVVKPAYAEYNTIEEGIDIMGKLSYDLTGIAAKGTTTKVAGKFSLDGKRAFAVSIAPMIGTGWGVGGTIIVYEKYQAYGTLGPRTFLPTSYFLTVKYHDNWVNFNLDGGVIGEQSFDFWQFGGGALWKVRIGEQQRLIFNFGLSLDFLYGTADGEDEYGFYHGDIAQVGMGLRTGLSYRFTPNFSLDLNVVGEIGFGNTEMPVVSSKLWYVVPGGSSQIPFAVGAELGLTFMLPY